MIEERVRQLIAGLQSGDVDMQISAIRQLAQTHDDRVIEALIDLLQNPIGALVREYILIENRGVTDNRFLEPVLKILQQSSIESHIMRAATYLGELRDQRAFQPLLHMLDKSYNNEETLYWIIRALGDLGDCRAVEPLVNLFAIGSAKIRRAVVIALGFIGDQRAFDILMTGLQDQDDWLRVDAIVALQRLEDDRAVEPLIELLQDSFTQIVKASAYALGNLGDQRALQPLLNCCHQTHTEEELMHIVEAIGKLGDPQAIDTLLPMFRNLGTPVYSFSKKDFIYNCIAVTLAQLGCIEVVPALVHVLRDGREVYPLRSNIAAALRQIATPEALAAVAEYEGKPS